MYWDEISRPVHGQPNIFSGRDDISGRTRGKVSEKSTYTPSTALYELRQGQAFS